MGWQARQHGLFGNIKEQQPEDVAEWVDADEVSSYHTFTVPYGPRFQAKKIEKLLFTKDLLLNAEWNRSKERTVNLHRHPAFFGTARDVFGDCCGFCPDPRDEEEALVAEKEAEIYIRGGLRFVADNPGRQQIGSFNPLTDDDWTEMAYVGNTARLCQAIVDGDVDVVRDWCAQADADVNRRDHTGRTPLQLAALCSTVEVARCLIENGARLVARMADGMTALHIAARRGNAAIVKAILEKSEENEEAEDEKLQKKLEEMRMKRGESKKKSEKETDDEDVEMGEGEERGSSDEDMVDDESLGGEDSDDEMTQGSYVRVKDKEATDADDANADDPDVYDVNVTSWDYPVSPLHLAIMGGHIETVETLVDTFGADVLLPIKIKDEYSQDPRSAILTLVLAAVFSPNAPDMARKLLSHGATSSQADMNESTALQFIVKEGNEKVFDMLLEYDAAAAKAAINHIALTGSRWNLQVKTPIAMALSSRHEELAIKLLDNGAHTELTLDAFRKAYQCKIEDEKDVDQLERLYLDNVTQPIQVAIQNDLPRAVAKLLDLGVSVNAVSKEAMAVMPKGKHLNAREPWGNHVTTVLEQVRAQQVDLRKALHLEDIPEVETLKEDSYYLEGTEAGTYRRWFVEGDLERAKQVVKGLQKVRDEDVSKQQDHEPGSKKKRQAIEETLHAFQQLEKRLVKAGAKTFSDLHPDVKVPEKNLPRKGFGYYGYSSKKFETQYETNHKYQISYLGPGKEDAYAALFDAAWQADTARVKELTLAPWRLDSIGAPPTEDGKEEAPPLQVAVQDTAGFSPFSIAVLRGHTQLARDIIEIATAQYKPRKNEAKYRYTLEEQQPPEYSDEGADSDSNVSNEVPVTSRLVDAQYTIDDIAALADTTESRVSPLTMLQWNCRVYRMLWSLEEHQQLDHFGHQPNFELNSWDVGYAKKYAQGHVTNLLNERGEDDRNTLWEYAILRGDAQLFRLLLDWGHDLTKRAESPDSDEPKTFEAPAGTFYSAIRYNRPEMAAELIRQDGNRLPLLKFVESSGAEVKEKPKYYQGLTVYGKKRKDWADRSRGVMATQPLEEDTPPFLLAAFENRVDCTEYFLGDAPQRRYEEFIEAHRDHKAIQALSEKPGGIKKVMTNWLGTRRELAIHASVLGPIVDKAHPTRQLEFLLGVMPNAVDAPNCDRITPLHAAFRAARVDAARLLIKKGADQVARDRCLENVLHHAVFSPEPSKGSDESLVKRLRTLFGLLSPGLAKDLLVQRSSTEAGGHTPLSKLLHRHSRGHAPPPAAAVRVVLEFSGGRDLTLMSGAGELPLHHVARRGWRALAALFLERDPALVRRENAVGATPLELLDTALLRRLVEHPPGFPYAYDRFNACTLRSRAARGGGVGREKEGGGGGPGGNTRRVCQEAAERAGPDGGRRRLVALWEANEVAQRLANREKGSGPREAGWKYDCNQNAEPEKKDEVDDWMRRANCHFP